MKIFIVGGGSTGSIIAHILASHQSVENVTIGDAAPERARKFIVQNPKIALRLIDAKNTHELAKALAGFDLVINSSMAANNESVMRSALEAKINYQDLDSDYKSGKVDQTRFHEQFKEKNLIALFNASASPGVTNLMAGELAENMKRIEYVRIRVLEDVSSDIPFTAWSKAIAFEEIYDEPYVWEFGKYVKRDNFADEETYNFPEPYLNTRCYLIDQDEIGTIPQYIKTRRADLKIGGSEIELARTLFKLGLLRKRQVRIGNALITPYDFMVKIWSDVPSLKEMRSIAASGKLRDAHFWAAVEIRGTVDEKKMTRRAVIQFPAQSEINKLHPGANYVSYAAGVSAAVFALHVSEIKERGTFPPEALLEEARAKIIAALKKQGVKITMEEKADAPAKK